MIFNFQSNNIDSIDSHDINRIKHTCNEFIAESRGIPLLKNLPESYGICKKVKARHSKKLNKINDCFDVAFDEHKLLQKAIYAHGPNTFTPILDENVCKYNIFYLFIPNKFRFLYNPAVINSEQTDYDILDSSLLSEVLQYGYVNEDLAAGIEQGAEIIIYNVPYFYAIRAQDIDYCKLLERVS